MTELWERTGHLLSLDEWDALPEDNSRHYELVEGVLIMSPRPRARHQLVMQRLAGTLDQALTPRWVTLVDYEVVTDARMPPTVRAPDIAVVDPAVLVENRPRTMPSDVLAVVEVLSPGTRRTDQIAKLADYADAGIESYLVADAGPPLVLTEFRLVDGAYRRRADHRGAAVITLDGVDVTIDLPGILDA